MLIGTFTGYFLGSFFKVITFTSSFSVLFRSKELSSSLFPSIFLKVKYLPKDSVFRVYFLIFFNFCSSFWPIFLDIFKNLNLFPRILSWSILQSFLGVRIFTRFISRSTSVVRTLPRSISRSTSVVRTLPRSTMLLEELPVFVGGIF